MINRRLRILFFASFFPKPGNPWMGTWALTQAQALARQEVDLLVVSGTAWLPSFLATTPGAKAYANCPTEYTWTGNVQVRYPRWLYYPIPPIRQWAYRNPEPYLQLAWWSARQALCRLVDQFQPDVLFCHHSLPNGWIVAHLPSHLQRPIITLDHDFDEIEDSNAFSQRKAAMQFVADHAWAMLTVSKRMETSLRNLCPNTRILTQHNGIDPLPETLFHQHRPVDLNGKTVILTCALFAERKGIPLLIEAFSRIANHYPDTLLRIIGSGPDETKIQQTVVRLNLHDRVQLIGKKSHADVLQEMVWADCFALVGWNEPFATVYLEAMAAGKPIICCQDGGINDVIQDGVEGYTVPPKDIAAAATALDRMLGNAAQRQIMGRNAQRLILEKLTWNAKTTELIKLFEQAVNQPQSVIAV